MVLPTNRDVFLQMKEDIACHQLPELEAKKFWQQVPQEPLHICEQNDEVIKLIKLFLL